jgi:hypothetical protein
VQASQQLVNAPTHAVPPAGALQLSAVCLVAHFVTPAAFVRQQVTNPAFPHVDLAAHFFTAPRQLLLTSTVLACCAAHLTYAPWLAAPVQSQLAATAARAAATSAASTPVVSHFASPIRGASESSDTVIRTTRRWDIAHLLAVVRGDIAP